MRIAPTLANVRRDESPDVGLARGPGLLRWLRMRSRLQTLPDRHGGRVVRALLTLVRVIALASRARPALPPPADPGNDASAYMQIAKGLYKDGHYGGPGQASPNDWSPGAPLL